MNLELVFSRVLRVLLIVVAFDLGGYAISASASDKNISVSIAEIETAYEKFELRKVISLANEAISGSQDNNSIYLYLAKAYFELGEYNDARQAVNGALKVNPNLAETLRVSGDVYCELAMEASLFKALRLAKKCVKSYEASFNKNDTDVGVIRRLVEYHLAAPSIAGGSDTRGEQLLEHLAGISKESADTLTSKMLAAKGDAEQALLLANQLSKDGFQSAINQYMIALVYRHAEQNEPARRLFSSLTEMEKSIENRWYVNDARLQLGELILIDGNEPDEALFQLKKYK